MTDTSGLKCLGSFARFGPVGSWEKTFLVSLIGTEAWYSTRCWLRWKLKGIGAPRRLSFQLAVKTPRTEEIGSGLLPTVMAQGEREPTLESTKARQEKYGGKRRAMYLGNVAALGKLPEPANRGQQLPTPKASDATHGGPNARDSSGAWHITAMASKGLLPTPTATNANEGEDPATWIKRKEEGSEAGMPLAITLNLGLLPTPRASENENRQTKLSPSQKAGTRGLSMAALASEGLLPTPIANDAKGKEGSPSEGEKPSLSAAFYRTFNDPEPDGSGKGKLLPTPRASEWKGTGPIGSPSHEAHVEQGYLSATLQEQTGRTFQLCHRYELEMMGFPVNWCDIPMEAVADIMRPKSKRGSAKKP